MVNAQGQILTFYQSHRKTINALAGHDCCKTVDRAQGSEWVDGILSTGRLHGVGFLKDRRRVNVALTRFKARLIVLLNVRCGIANPFWTALRRFLSNLDAVVHVGNIDGGAHQIEGAVTAVVRKAEMRGVITVEQVRTSANVELKSIFDAYQLHVVGPLNSILPLDDSDDDMSAAEVISEQRAEEIPVNPRGEERDDDCDADVGDYEHPPWSPLSLWPAPAPVELEGAASMERFAFLSVCKVNKLFHAATLSLSPLEREMLNKKTNDAHGRSLKYCIQHFGFIMQQALSRFHWDPQNGQRLVLLDHSISYPQGCCVVLRHLAQSADACAAFLEALYSYPRGHWEGTCLFYQWNADWGKTPRLNLKDVMWKLVLPYCIVWPLVLVL